MTDEEKIKFVNRVFECESQVYASSGKRYDYQTEFWFHKYLSKGEFDEDSNKKNLDVAYQIALNLNKDK